MRENFLEVRDEPNEDAVGRSVRLGMVCKLLTASPAHWRMPLGQHVSEVLVPAIAHRMLRIFYDRRGDPIGYVAWARIAEDTEARFLQSGLWRLHISEWNEGGQLWIVDAAAPFGHFASIFAKLLDQDFSRDQTVRFGRLRGSRLVIKEMDRATAKNLLMKSLAEIRFSG